MGLGEWFCYSPCHNDNYNNNNYNNHHVNHDNNYNNDRAGEPTHHINNTSPPQMGRACA
jgi:hypothetical protein